MNERIGQDGIAASDIMSNCDARIYTNVSTLYANFSAGSRMAGRGGLHQCLRNTKNVLSLMQPALLVCIRTFIRPALLHGDHLVDTTMLIITNTIEHVEIS